MPILPVEQKRSHASGASIVSSMDTKNFGRLREKWGLSERPKRVGGGLYRLREDQHSIRREDVYKGLPAFTSDRMHLATSRHDPSGDQRLLQRPRMETLSDGATMNPWKAQETFCDVCKKEKTTCAVSYEICMCAECLAQATSVLAALWVKEQLSPGFCEQTCIACAEVSDILGREFCAKVEAKRRV